MTCGENKEREGVVVGNEWENNSICELQVRGGKEREKLHLTTVV